MPRRGRDALLDVLRSEGVRHLFGNPGSTELPLIDALATADDLHYVLALQEATAVGMADGYAQATGRPAFLNLHTSAGTGNAIGNLTNAQAIGTPLVVTAGQQDYRHIEADPMLSGDLVGLARPVSKWAHEVRTSRELGTILRRAFHDAAAPPAGPVFVSLPMNLLDEEGECPVPPRSDIGRRTVADRLADLAAALCEPAVGRLAIVAGDEVGTSRAHAELAAVAEALGAPVFAAPLHADAVFPPTHPLFAGMLPMNAEGIRAALTPFERVFFVGGQPFRVYPYSDGPPLPEGTDLVHLSPDVTQLGRTFPVVLGVAGDPRATLAAVLPFVEKGADTASAADALAAARTRREVEIERFDALARERYGSAPVEPMAAAHAAVTSLPPGAAVVDEAITTGFFVRSFHHWTEPGRYFFCKGGGLGWGMPAALGVALAHDRQVPVLCAVGDGSAMYSPQALWTAAREELPVVFTVFVNRQYLILKNNLRLAKGDAERTGVYVGLDLDRPAVDYVALARSMGVEGTLVASAAEAADVVRAAAASGRPHLVEIPIAAPA